MLAAVGVGSVVLAAILIQPFASGPVGFDSAASVIHFDRIVAGRHLEAFVTATPKPLLTVGYGILHALTGDWRSISWATIIAFGVAVALGVWLAARLAGLAAAAFVAVALIGSRVLLSDVSIGYAAVWAVVGCLVAGLAVSGPHRRPAVAGIALALASLARLETLIVVAVAGLALVLASWWFRGRRGGPDRRDWLVLLGFTALPVMLAHDWLLTGDPMFWLSVSAHYSAAAVADTIRGPVELARDIATRYLRSPVSVTLAVVGAIALVRDRQWGVAVGLAGLGPGIVAFLLLLAARGTYVSSRYFVPVDLAVAFTAALGAGAIATWLLSRLRSWRSGGGSTFTSSVLASTAAASVALVVVGAGLAVVATGRPAPLVASFRATLDTQRLVAVNADGALDQLGCAMAALATDDPSGAVILVPGLERPRLAVDLDVPLDRVAGNGPSMVAPGPGFLPVGRLVYHDRLADQPPEAFDALEVDTPTRVGSMTLVPLRSDPSTGVWIGTDRSRRRAIGRADL